MTPSASPSASLPADAYGGGLGPAELPRGGTLVFPHYRLVGYSGGPGSAAFGRLGVGNIDARVNEIDKLGRSRYASDGRTPLPVLELIAVVVQSKPGKDGKYRVRVDDATIAGYLAAARRHHALLLLNVQPGRADFLPEVQGLQRWLVQPDVGVALDPEWAVEPGQVPGRVFGRTTGAELNGVSLYLQSLVAAHHLPEKVMVVHQLSVRIIQDFRGLRMHNGVAAVLSVDGIGNQAEKVETWRKLVAGMPRGMHAGFKLFFDEDRRGGSGLMPPAAVLGLTPRPEYVLYE